MNLKIRLVRTGIMTVIMCGIMSLLVLLFNRGLQAGIFILFIRWMRNWLIAICALFPVSFFVSAAVAMKLQKAGLSGLRFRAAFSAILAVLYTCWMTFVMAAVNVGFTVRLIPVWLRSIRILLGIAFILLFVLTPIAARWAEKLCGGRS